MKTPRLVNETSLKQFSGLFEVTDRASVTRVKRVRQVETGAL